MTKYVLSDTREGTTEAVEYDSYTIAQQAQEQLTDQLLVWYRDTDVEWSVTLKRKVEHDD